MRGNFRRLALPLAALLVLIAAGTAGGASKAGTLVFAGASDPTYLDPALVSDGESFRVTEQMFEGLVKLKPGTTKIVPSLATSWNLKGGKVWTFNLRKGVKFHDGTPWNAAAACDNFNRWYNWTGPFQDPSATFYYQATYGGFKKTRSRTCRPRCSRAARTVGKYKDHRELTPPVGRVLPVARDPVVRDAEPDGDEEVRRRRGRRYAAARSSPPARMPSSIRPAPARSSSRPGRSARRSSSSATRATGARRRSSTSSSSGRSRQRGALPGAQDRRDQRLRPGPARRTSDV